MLAGVLVRLARPAPAKEIFFMRAHVRTSLLLTSSILIAAVASVPIALGADDAVPPTPAPTSMPEPVVPSTPPTIDAAPAAQTAGTPHAAAERGPAHRLLATSLSISTTDATPRVGQAVTLAGQLTPAASAPLVIERWNGSTWTTLYSLTTAADGTWTRIIKPSETMRLRARMADDSATSDSRRLVVRPYVVIRSIGTAPAFVGVRVALNVYPATYRGRITFAVRYGGRVAARITRRATNGRLVVTIPNNGVGKLPVVMTAPPSRTLVRSRSTFTIGAPVRPLHIGSSGADVAALMRRLDDLNFHTPGTPRRYDMRVGEVVLAFRKAHRMTRTYTVDRATWRAIAAARPMRPRFASPARHIEVDKTRQIMMVVRNGAVVGTLHVSTGATGNTPVGRWHIYQKGGSHLYKFMAFIGNYGIHGYVPVPTFPASHGCVREPMWAAAWTYAITDYGDTVIVYT